MARLLVIVGILAAGGYMASFGLDQYTLRLACKPIPVLCMMFWLWRQERDPYTLAILMGLFFSLGGDIFLELKVDLFLVGLVSFLIAHLCYIGAYLYATRKAALLQSLPFFAYGAAFYAFLYGSLAIKKPALVAPVGIYTFVICAMLWRSSVLLQEGSIPRRSAWFAFWGAILFAISDSVLAYNRFVEPVIFGRYVIISTYWLGQWGIMLSVKRLAEEKAASEGVQLVTRRRRW